MSPTTQRRRRRGGKHHGHAAYNRPPTFTSRYGPSPGPPTAYSVHEIYSQGVGGEPYAPSYPNNYVPEPEPWQPEPSLYPRPPSPALYGYQSGSSTSGWAPQSWDAPVPPQWPDRVEQDPRFDGDQWLHEHRDTMTMAQPMFEPNDSWKQSHVGPPDAPRNDVAPEPYSPSRRFLPRLSGDHYSPPRPPASDHYAVGIPGPAPFSNDYYSQVPSLAGPPPSSRDQYDTGPSSSVHLLSGDHYPQDLGFNVLPFVQDDYSTRASSGLNVLPFSGDHYSPARDLSGQPPFSGDHYSPGRSLNGPRLSSDRCRPETPPVYPYMNPGSDSYRPRYDAPDSRTSRPPNSRIHPRWRLPSTERKQSVRGNGSTEVPNSPVRNWQVNRKTSLHDPNDASHYSPKRWSPPPRDRDTGPVRSRVRSVSRDPSASRSRSPLYTPRLSPMSLRGRRRSPSPSRSLPYSPRASPGPAQGPIRSPVRGRTRSPLHGRTRSPVRGRTRSPARGPLIIKTTNLRTYVARLGRSRSRPPNVYRPGKSRSRSPLSRYTRPRSRASYSRSPSPHSDDSLRRTHGQGHRRSRSRTRRSISGSQNEARSRSRGRSRSKASTIYSPTTTRLYSPNSSRKRLSPTRGRGRSGDPANRRIRPSDAVPQPVRLPTPPQNALACKSKRSNSTESAGSIYGPEIPPELRARTSSAVPAVQRSRDSSLSSYKSDNATPQITSIPGLSDVGRRISAVPPPAMLRDAMVTVVKEVSPQLVTQDASKTECADRNAKDFQEAVNDELRAAVTKLVNEQSTSRIAGVTSLVREDVQRPSGNTNGVVKSPGIQIPSPDEAALQQKTECEGGESDMDVSLPTTPVDKTPQPMAAILTTEIVETVQSDTGPINEGVADDAADVDMDVDMDMSTPTTPVLLATPALTVTHSEDDATKPNVVATNKRVVQAQPSQLPSANTVDPGTVELKLSSRDRISDLGLVSNPGDESIIPGLDVRDKSAGLQSRRYREHYTSDDPVVEDELAIPGLTISAAGADDPSPLTVRTLENENVAAVNVTSAPAAPLPTEEDECDMDMSPPPSPVSVSLQLGIARVLSPVQPDICVALSREPTPVAEHPLAEVIIPETHEDPYSLVTGEPTVDSVHASPIAAQMSLLNEPPSTVAPASIPTFASELQKPVAPEPDTLTAQVDEAPQKSASISREGSPMVVESLLGLAEPSSAAESIVITDESSAPEGSPTVVGSSSTSPKIQVTAPAADQHREIVISASQEHPGRPLAAENERVNHEQSSGKISDGTSDVVERAVGSAANHDERAYLAQNEDGINPLAEALRVVVRTRLQWDRQTKEERIAPVLMANLSRAEAYSCQRPSADRLCDEIFQGKRNRDREDSFARVRPSLQTFLAQRQASLTENVRKLREDYRKLHDRWMVHCAKLDEVAKAAALEEAAATAGRTTRRSAALGDAVRTDLEMEQIIASLGNDELTDANHLAARNAATIPDMLSVTKGSIDYSYDDTNNAVEDPASFYTPNTCLEDWTEEEREIFLEKYALYPKQFGIIADFLPNKTTAECVTYYYLHKKTLIDFRNVLAKNATGKRKRGGGRSGKKKGNALLEDIRKHDAEVSRDTTPSGSTARRRRGAQTAENGEPPPRRASTRRSAIQAENSPGTTPTPDPDPEPRKRRRAPKPTTRAVAAVEQEVEEETIEPVSKPAKRARRSRKVKSAETVESPVMSEAPLLFNETRFIDQTELTARKRTPTGSVQWTEEDKELFIRLLAQHGDDFKRISASMPNKTAIQLNVYYKANVAELNLGSVAAKGRKRTPSPDPPSVSDGYKEMSLPGSGVITPTTRASTPSVAPASSSSNFEAQFRLNDPSTVYKSKLRGSGSNLVDLDQRPVSRPGSSLAVPSSSSRGNLQFYSTSLEMMRAQYGGLSDSQSHLFPFQSRPSPFASVIPPPLTMNGSPFVDAGLPLHAAPGSGSDSGSGSGLGLGLNSGSASGSLTMTFPSNFAYSNLSPSHFSGEQRLPPRGYTMRRASPGSAPASATMMFEASMFAPVGGSPFTFSAPGATGEAPAMPATLQTTEDLVAYLEHRTRFGERESDFM